MDITGHMFAEGGPKAMSMFSGHSPVTWGILTQVAANHFLTWQGTTASLLFDQVLFFFFCFFWFCSF